MSTAPHASDRGRLLRLLWLSIAAAVATIALKTTAWLLTGSVGLLSDAAESVVNLVAAVIALGALKWAAKPADEHHAYGHAKAEYLSAGIEAALIVIAAVTIAVTAIDRLLHPQPLSDVGVGLAISIAASAINLAVGLLLVRNGRRHRSITLEADGKHLLTDVWTSAGVVIGVAAVAISGWERLDPIVALAVAANIVATGIGVIRRSAGGLMDRALDDTAMQHIGEVLGSYTSDDVSFHALRTRQAGRRAFVSLHILVPGGWTVRQGHAWRSRLSRRCATSCLTQRCSPTSSRRTIRARSLTRHSTAPPTRSAERAALDRRRWRHVAGPDHEGRQAPKAAAATRRRAAVAA